MNVMVTALLAASVFSAPVFAADVVPVKTTPMKADSLFAQADRNHDGKLDKAEFEVFKKLQEDRLILQIKQRIDKMQFAAFDKDADNGITQDELKAARIEARQKMMQNLRDRQLQIKPLSVTPVPSGESVKK
jgi:Ca2+-binding EF-hand superfamily protein